jgi:hypothetical protein
LIVVEIVRKNPDQVGFAVNPRRWVERFFAWSPQQPVFCTYGDRSVAAFQQPG